MKTPVAKWIQCALLAALTAILSQIVIPVGPVPINLATLSVLLAGGLLGGKYGAASQGVYLLMGIVGIPVFTMLRAGYGVLLGPTGGYIIGYVAAALITGLWADRLGRGPVLIPGMAVGILSCYALGTAWYMYSGSVGLWQALVICVFPFLLGDALKIQVAYLLVRRLHPVLRRMSTMAQDLGREDLGDSPPPTPSSEEGTIGSKEL